MMSVVGREAREKVNLAERNGGQVGDKWGFLQGHTSRQNITSKGVYA